jgi:hypothetical protein
VTEVWERKIFNSLIFLVVDGGDTVDPIALSCSGLDGTNLFQKLEALSYEKHDSINRATMVSRGDDQVLPVGPCCWKFY